MTPKQSREEHPVNLHERDVAVHVADAAVAEANMKKMRSWAALLTCSLASAAMSYCS